MSNEITINLEMSLINGALKQPANRIKLNVDQTTAGRFGHTQNIAAGAHEALDMGELTTAGYAQFTNLDSTNYVEIGIDDTGTFEPLVKLKAGEAAILRLTTNAPYARANTAAVDLDYLIFED